MTPEALYNPFASILCFAMGLSPTSWNVPTVQLCQVTALTRMTLVSSANLGVGHNLLALHYYMYSVYTAFSTTTATTVYHNNTCTCALLAMHWYYYYYIILLLLLPFLLVLLELLIILTMLYI